jgi:hypothetical protein
MEWIVVFIFAGVVSIFMKLHHIQGILSDIRDRMYASGDGASRDDPYDDYICRTPWPPEPTADRPATGAERE